MNTTPVLSTKPAATSLPSKKFASGLPVEILRLPKEVYSRLYREAERVRKLPEGKRLAAGAELLTVIFELSESLEAVQLALHGALELRTRPD